MKHAKRIGLASLLLLLLVASAAAVAGSTPADAAAKGKRVTIQNFAFAPQTIRVKAGTRVTWKNTDTAVHQLTSTNSMKTTAHITGLFSSASLSKGATFSFTFKKKGKFFYECTIHAAMASMHGKVVVK